MKKRTFLTWFALGHLANDWPIASLWLIVPTVGIALELSPTEVGLLFTIFNVGGALAYLPAGILTDHVSNRGRLLAATFWWVAIGYLLAAMAPGYWSLALLLAVAGIGKKETDGERCQHLCQRASDSVNAECVSAPFPAFAR